MRVRKVLAVPGAAASAALLADVAAGFDPVRDVPVVLADSANQPSGPRAGTVTGLTFDGRQLIAELEVTDPATERGIANRTVLGAAAVVSTGQRRLIKAAITNRPPKAPVLALSASDEAGTLMLSAPSWEDTVTSIAGLTPGEITDAIAELAAEAGMPPAQLHAGVMALAESGSLEDITVAVAATAQALGLGDGLSLASDGCEVPLSGYGYDGLELELASSLTAAERRHLAAIGQALPDGSYPVPDHEHLVAAARLAASHHGDYRAARKLIIKRAHELGVEVATLPGFSAADHDVREHHERHGSARMSWGAASEVMRLSTAHPGLPWDYARIAASADPPGPVSLPTRRDHDDSPLFGLTAGQAQAEADRLVALSAGYQHPVASRETAEVSRYLALANATRDSSGRFHRAPSATPPPGGRAFRSPGGGYGLEMDVTEPGNLQDPAGLDSDDASVDAIVRRYLSMSKGMFGAESPQSPNRTFGPSDPSTWGQRDRDLAGGY